MATNLLLTMGQLPEGFCPSSYQEIANEIMANAQVQLPEAFGFGLFTFGPNTPTVDQRLYPWFKTNLDGTPDDIYIYVGGQWVGFGFSRPPAQNLFCGRLTLASGDPLPSVDQIGSTLYLTPYNGNVVTLWNGAKWIVTDFEEISFNANAFLANKNYDIWAYWTGTEVALESDVWTDGTTRATNITLFNGVYVKSGDSTRRYIGTVRTTAVAGQLSDTVTQRYLYNYFNAIPRHLEKFVPGLWSVTTNWRIWKNDATARIDFVLGVPTLVDAYGKMGAEWGASDAAMALGLNSVTVPISDTITGKHDNGVESAIHWARYSAILPAGYAYLAGMDIGAGGSYVGSPTLVCSNVGSPANCCFLKAEIVM